MIETKQDPERFKSKIKNSKDNMSKGGMNLIRSFSFFIILALFGIALYLSNGVGATKSQVALSDVIARANDENGNIAKITVTGNSLNITLKGESDPTEYSYKDSSGTLYDLGLVNHCENLTGNELVECQKKYPTIEYTEPVDYFGIVINVLTIVVPIIVIVLFLSYMMRQAQSMNKESMGFGKSKAKLYVP